MFTPADVNPNICRLCVCVVINKRSFEIFYVFEPADVKAGLIVSYLHLLILTLDWSLHIYTGTVQNPWRQSWTDRCLFTPVQCKVLDVKAGLIVAYLHLYSAKSLTSKLDWSLPIYTCTVQSPLTSKLDWSLPIYTCTVQSPWRQSGTDRCLYSARSLMPKLDWSLPIYTCTVQSPWHQSGTDRCLFTLVQCKVLGIKAGLIPASLCPPGKVCMEGEEHGWATIWKHMERRHSGRNKLGGSGWAGVCVCVCVCVWTDRENSNSNRKTYFTRIVV